MKEVFETVSEVQFRSIALIIALACLGMGVTWWFLTGSASPPLTIDKTAYESDASSKVVTEPEVLSVQPTSPSENPQILVEGGSASTVTAPSSPESTSGVGQEGANGHFTAQIGAFQQEERARKQLEKLKEKGYEARLIAHEEGGGIIFRLIFGDFRSHEEAAVAVKDLKSSGIDAFVRGIEIQPQ